VSSVQNEKIRAQFLAARNAVAAFLLEEAGTAFLDGAAHIPVVTHDGVAHLVTEQSFRRLHDGECSLSMFLPIVRAAIAILSPSQEDAKMALDFPSESGHRAFLTDGEYRPIHRSKLVDVSVMAHKIILQNFLDLVSSTDWTEVVASEASKTLIARGAIDVASLASRESEFVSILQPIILEQVVLFAQEAQQFAPA